MQKIYPLIPTFVEKINGIYGGEFLSADFKNKADAETIYRVIKKFNAKVKMMNEEEWEDYILGLIAMESEAEGETVPRSEVSKWFKEHGIDF